MDKVNQNWERMTEPLFEILMEKEIVYTEANHGNWLTVKQSLFDRLPENETKELLQRVLLAANQPIVTVPRHVMDTIDAHSAYKEITASFTRLVMKRAPVCYKKLSRGEKLLLLHFCLSDCQFTDLCDLELLPLSNGTFISFSKRADVIYISSSEHPRELLPGLRHRFLDEAVDFAIIEKLNEAAGQGKKTKLHKNACCVQLTQ